jgi:molecular chaperone DnaK
MALIGIDLGTTYSAAARYLGGEQGAEIIPLEDGQPILPSVVSVLANGKIAVGWKAKRNQANRPQDTVVEVKRQMGKKVEVRLGQKLLSPPEVSALILKRIRELAEEELGEPVEGAVISCPAYFKDPERQAIKQAAEIAGIKLLSIINEPTAAAYAYGATIVGADEKKLFLVYDLGGGTFDVTVIEMTANNLKVIGTGGDPSLGGGNFDDCIVDWMLEHLDKVPGYSASLTEEKRAALKMRLKYHAEEAKKNLCGRDGRPRQEQIQVQIASVDRFDGKPVVFDQTLSMAEFERRIADLLQNSLKWVEEALTVPKSERFGYSEADITEILLVGGSTRVPAVRKLLTERFPKTPIRGMESGINPDEVVAKGASIVAAQSEDSLVEVEGEKVLTDVTGHTLSVAVMDQSLGREILHPLIPKETQVPCGSAHKFASYGDFPRPCKIRVFQGEGREPKDEKVTMIGEFLLDIDPIKEPTPIEIGLRLDSNSLLVAMATNLLNGQQVHCEINYADAAQLPQAELERRRKALEEMQRSGIGATANVLDGGGAPTGAPAPGRPAAAVTPAATVAARPVPMPAEPAAGRPAPAAAPTPGWGSPPGWGQPGPESARQLRTMAELARNGRRVADPMPQTSGHEEDFVDCTVFAPPGAAPGTNCMVQVFVHLTEAASEAAQLAREMDDTASRRAFKSLEAKVAPGTRLTISLRIPSISVDDSVQTLVWNHRSEAVQFGLNVPKDRKPGTIVGTVTVARDSIPIGHLKFKFEITAHPVDTAQLPVGADVRRYTKAFISYASKDRSAVLARVQMLRLSCIDYFQDVLDLEPGDRWEKALFGHIDECDLFLLFWSRAASESEWVLKEVKYALKCKRGDEAAPPEIQPVIIEGPPIAPPPPELAHLHFNDRLLYFISDPQQQA